MGDPSGWRGHERNGVWRNFVGPASRVRHTPEERQALRGRRWSPTCARPPAAIRRPAAAAADRGPAGEQRRGSPSCGIPAPSAATQAARKTVDHPQVGPLTLDCDVLTVAGSDLRIMVYTAEPGTQDAERLALLTVLGTQALVG